MRVVIALRAYEKFLKFLLVGGASAVLTIILRALLTPQIGFEGSVGVSHVAGLTMAFSLNCLFVFSTFRGSVVAAYCRFFVVNMMSLAIATIVSSILYRFVFVMIPVGAWGDYYAHFIGLGCAAIPSYFGHSRFSFRPEVLAGDASLS